MRWSKIKYVETKLNQVIKITKKNKQNKTRYN